MAGRNPAPAFAVRSCEGVSLFRGVEKGAAPIIKDEGNAARCIVFSPDGQLFAWCNGKSIVVAEVGTGRKVTEFPRSRTTAMVFSPKRTFLAAWEGYQIKPGATSGANNMAIWNIATGELVFECIQKRMDGWEPQWTDDESLCARNVTNQVDFYEGQNFAKGIVNRLQLPGLEKFSLSPGAAPYKISAFIAGKKGAPSSVRLYEIPRFESGLSNKSFYKADKVDMVWNKQGTAVLVSTQTEVDKTGQSYYGETNLYYLTAAGLSVAVQLDKQGPISDFDWSPDGTEFVVVYGFMPARAALFNKTGDRVKDFGSGPRNLVKYSPHGNIICLAGFGNLRGEVELWGREKCQLLNKLQASDSTVFEWGPDSRHILTATTSPRLKVDNGHKIWHYMNGLVLEVPCKELWDVKWCPAPGQYDERPISPKPSGAVQTAAAAAKPGVYRPPGARGAPSTIKLHEEEEKEDEDDEKEGDGLSKAALKNKKKREAKARAAALAAAAEGAGAGASAELTKDRKAALEAARVVLAEPAKAAAAAESAASGEGGSEGEKKLRNLNKKLRQIDELKEKQARGEFLQANQVEKIQAEASVKEEIRALEAQLAAAKVK
eukprot:m.124886 g.124886  ORF g.124886 m.124886 type:complete len:603 (-) comp16306_c0_seq2:233-2041(-)